METFLKALAVATLGIFAPVVAVMAVTGFLIFADMITGIMAALKRGEKITSSAMRRTVSKMCIYHIVILAGFLVEVYMMGGVVPISKMAAVAIGTTELLSILENASTVLEQDIFTKIKQFLGSKNDQKDDKDTQKPSGHNK